MLFYKAVLMDKLEALLTESMANMKASEENLLTNKRVRGNWYHSFSLSGLN